MSKLKTTEDVIKHNAKMRKRRIIINFKSPSGIAWKGYRDRPYDEAVPIGYCIDCRWKESLCKCDKGDK